MKILLLGLSASGKSTVSLKLAKKYNLILEEADDEVRNLNGNNWSFNDGIITEAFKTANNKAIHMDNVIYVTSWLSQDEIAEFYKSGFKIIEMHASFDELVRRKIKKDFISRDMINKFKDTYKGYFDTVLPDEMKQYYKLSLDTTKITEDEVFIIISRTIDLK